MSDVFDAKVPVPAEYADEVNAKLDELRDRKNVSRPVEDERVYSDTEQRILSVDVAARLYERNELSRSDAVGNRMSRGQSVVATAEEIRAYLFPKDGA